MEFECQQRKQKAWMHILVDWIELFLKFFFFFHILNIIYCVPVLYTMLNLIAQNSSESMSCIQIQ